MVAMEEGVLKSLRLSGTRIISCTQGAEGERARFFHPVAFQSLASLPWRILGWL